MKTGAFWSTPLRGQKQAKSDLRKEPPSGQGEGQRLAFLKNARLSRKRRTSQRGPRRRQRHNWCRHSASQKKPRCGGLQLFGVILGKTTNERTLEKRNAIKRLQERFPGDGGLATGGGHILKIQLSKVSKAEKD